MKTLLLALAVGAAFPLHAAEESKAPKLGWFDSTELSVVYTAGNSNSHTYGFKDTLRRFWANARFKLKADYLRADTADERHLLVGSGITFLPGEQPSDPPVTLIDPPVEPDVVARVVLEDPDGVSGSGDEYFRTVSSGGFEITVGESPVHKEQLDTVFRTTLVIDS